ncbi:hypothetical protein [Membranihabitans marinus]|uniref:hypothetical protein n=1 Tax=Membranihabitans marinus TaxID=1227546 RepID=UPI001F2C203D|nr:hypothetical protein [Membranihabitans marinus]
MDHIDEKVRNQLAADPNWSKEELDEYQFLKKVSEGQRSKVLNAKLNLVRQIEDSSDLDSRKRSTSIYWIIGVAAALILLLVIFIPGSRSDNVFANEFQPYPDMDLVRGEVNVSQREAFTFYNAGDYQSSMVLFEQVHKETNDDKYLFYAGNAALANEEFDIALTYFQQINIDINFLSQYPYYYYLGLTYLALDRHSEAVESLEKQGEVLPYYFDKAKKILSELSL